MRNGFKGIIDLSSEIKSSFKRTGLFCSKCGGEMVVDKTFFGEYLVCEYFVTSEYVGSCRNLALRSEKEKIMTKEEKNEIMRKYTK